MIPTQIEASRKIGHDVQLIMIQFQRMCEEAMWRVRAFRNPFFHEGEEVDGKRTISVNLEARKPYNSHKGASPCGQLKIEHGELVVG